MSISYTIDEARAIVFDRIEGTLTDEEMYHHSQVVHADPRFRDDFRQIVDFRSVTDLAISSAAVRANAANTLYGGQGLRAFVVATDAAFGMARMYQLSLGATTERLRVFRDLGDAFEWLGLPRDTPWPAPDRVLD